MNDSTHTSDVTVHLRWATVPNAITLIRLLLLVPIMFFLTTSDDPVVTLVLVVVFGSTDWVDGYLARRLGQVSRVGEILDPIADRLGIGGIGIALAIIGTIQWWVIIVILGVDAIVFTMTLALRGKQKLRVSVIGKLRTAIIMLSVVALVCGLIPTFGWATVAGHVGMMAGALLHVAAAADYIHQLVE